MNDMNSTTTSTRIPYLVSENVPDLGRKLAQRFLEWAEQNPEGCVSLPTGKTALDFIKNVQMQLPQRKTDLSGLHFVQMDEFYPIVPAQHNSIFHFVKEHYLDGLGFDPGKALLINCEDIRLYEGCHFSKVFPDSIVDLSLRYREPESALEKIQQQSIFCIDDWCDRFEDRIRALGGIGFFMSSIGTDGRIAFNMRGSNLHSCTRLTATNFPTQADAANDLGGFNISKHRLVITLGLETVKQRSDAVVIVYAAGESNAEIVRQTLESEPSTRYPGSAFQGMGNACFYLTPGSASRLRDTLNRYYDKSLWNFEKTERAVLGLCKTIERYAHKLTLEDLQNDPRCSLIPHLSLGTVQEVIRDVETKLFRGVDLSENEVIYHTGPHHDDIMLGIMPLVNRQMRNPTNDVHFAIMTSGHHSVTNGFMLEALEEMLGFLKDGRIQMVQYPDFFEKGYLFKRDKDVYHYLDNVARKNTVEMKRGFCHRLLRDAVGLWRFRSVEEVVTRIEAEIQVLRNSYDGEPNTPDLQKLKGYVREFEEELVWAYAGVPVSHVHHLRLGFYNSSEGFPNRERDVDPILTQFRKLKPTMLTVAMDPEGMGPDTHYKVFQSVAKAVSIWNEEEDLSRLKIMGYRNVWSAFHPAEANIYVPVSLNAFAVIEKSFRDSYLTQVKAEFPSPLFDGPFSELSESIWVKQLKDIQLILGKNYFYENSHPLIRATHGLIFLKEMNVKEFLASADAMRSMTDE